MRTNFGQTLDNRENFGHVFWRPKFAKVFDWGNFIFSKLWTQINFGQNFGQTLDFIWPAGAKVLSKNFGKNFGHFIWPAGVQSSVQKLWKKLWTKLWTHLT